MPPANVVVLDHSLDHAAIVFQSQPLDERLITVRSPQLTPALSRAYDTCLTLHGIGTPWSAVC
ncbi:MAG: hypothetical protein WBQ13_15350, partial [Terriglobales bacterium]